MKPNVVKPELLPVIQKTLDPKARYGRSIRCPFHSDREPSLHIFENQSWYCFGCGKGGDVFDLLGYLRYGDRWNHNNREMFREVIRGIESTPFSNTRIEDRFRDADRELTPETLDTFRLAADAYHRSLTGGREAGAQKALKYLQNRGIREKTIRKLRIGYAGKSTLHRNGLTLDPDIRPGYISSLRESGLIREDREYFYERIIFPNITKSGEVLNLTGRSLLPVSKRYLNIPNVKRNLYLLGLTDPDRELYLTESVTDAVTLHQLGFAAAAVNGTALSRQMAASLEPYEKILIVPQNDQPSMQAALEWCEAVPRCRVILPDYEDGKEKDVNDILRLEGEQRCGAKLRIASAKPMDCTDYLRAVRNKFKHGDE